MPIHSLTFKQVLPAPLAPVWEFFSNPHNLRRITPPELGFETRSEPPEAIYPGLMIQYRVRPIFGLPMTWLTEITHVVPGQMFVDEQRAGPYRIWHHEHHFRALTDESVEMEDRITYQLPFGWLGNLAHGFLVRPQLRRIFAFREKVVREEIFPSTGRRG